METEAAVEERAVETEVTDEQAQQAAAEAEKAEAKEPGKPAELSEEAKAEAKGEETKKKADELLGGLKEPEEDEAEEASAEEAAKEEDKTDVKGSVMSLASGLYPDREVKSEADAVGAINEYINDSREYREKQEAATKRLSELFHENPDLVDAVHLMNEGATFEEAWKYISGEADESALEGDKKAWHKRASDIKKSKADQQKSIEEINKNWEISMTKIKKFGDENNMSDDDVAEFLDTLTDVMNNVSRGNITEEIMAKLLKGLKHEKVLADETEKAEVRGKNEGIKEATTKKAEKKGDGLPRVKSASTEKAETEEGDTPEKAMGRNIDNWADSRKF